MTSEMGEHARLVGPTGGRGCFEEAERYALYSIGPICPGLMRLTWIKPPQVVGWQTAAMHRCLRSQGFDRDRDIACTSISGPPPKNRTADSCLEIPLLIAWPHKACFEPLDSSPYSIFLLHHMSAMDDWDVKAETPALKRPRLAEATPFLEGASEAGISAQTPFLPPPSEAIDHLKMVTSEKEPRSVLVCGDMYGRLDLLHAKLIELKREVDLVLAVGQFLPPNEMCSRISDYVGSAAARVLPVPVYFIDSASEVFIKKAEQDKKPVLLQPNLTFLGSCGIAEVAGLRIAYLSGSYDAEVFKQKWGRGLFDGPHYTSAALDKIEKQAFMMHRRGESIDILLTSEWPDKVWSSHAKAWVTPVVKKTCSSPAVSRLAAKLCPQYHICGIADRFCKVKSDRRSGAIWHSTTSVSLAHVRELHYMDGQAKWCETLSIRPSAKKAIAPVIVDIEDEDLLLETKREGLSAKAEMQVEGVD